MFAGRAPGRGRSGSQRCTKCHWKRWWILQELLLNLTTTPPSKHLQKRRCLKMWTSELLPLHTVRLTHDENLSNHNIIIYICQSINQKMNQLIKQLIEIYMYINRYYIFSNPLSLSLSLSNSWSCWKDIYILQNKYIYYPSSTVIQVLPWRREN